jgi:hypothetical protein
MLRLSFVVVFTVDEAARLANQHVLALRTRYLCVRLKSAHMRFALPRMKQLTAGAADQRLLAKAALHAAPSQWSAVSAWWSVKTGSTASSLTTKH